jgi:hypothetical protein
MSYIKKNRNLILLLLITLLTVVYVNTKVDRSKFTYRVINNDIISYYAYLPAYFIYDDITLKFKDKDPKYFGDKFWADTVANGNYIIRTSMGMSVMYFPFFAVTHAYTMLTGGDANGYSMAYHLSLIVSSIVYLMFGVFFLFKFLRKYFSEWASLLSCFLIVLATNLFEFATIDAAMSHAFSFSLISVLLYLTQSWYQSISWKKSLLMGLLIGLIILIRPTNAVVVLVVALLGVANFEGILTRFKYYLQNYLHILLVAVSVFVVWIPQFIYWHTITGSYIVNSYDNSGGSFFFSNPQIFNQLFSFRKGLLVYTPILAFAFIGMLILYFKQRTLFWAVLIFTAVNTYLLSCWWAWWFGGGFGARGYIDSYPVMAIGLAATIQLVLTRGILLKAGFFVLAAFFTFLNLFQTYQYYKGSIHYVGMTKEAYFANFLKVYPTKEFYENLVIPNYENAKKGIYFQDEKSKKQSFEEHSDDTKLKLFEDAIRNNPVWMEEEAIKAKKKGISLDSMVRMDARWLLKKDLEKKQSN